MEEESSDYGKSYLVFERLFSEGQFIDQRMDEPIVKQLELWYTWVLIFWVESW